MSSVIMAYVWLVLGSLINGVIVLWWLITIRTRSAMQQEVTETCRTVGVIPPAQFRIIYCGWWPRFKMIFPFLVGVAFSAFGFSSFREGDYSTAAWVLFGAYVFILPIALVSLANVNRSFVIVQQDWFAYNTWNNDVLVIPFARLNCIYPIKDDLPYAGPRQRKLYLDYMDEKNKKQRLVLEPYHFKAYDLAYKLALLVCQDAVTFQNGPMFVRHVNKFLSLLQSVFHIEFTQADRHYLRQVVRERPQGKANKQNSKNPDVDFSDC